MTGPEPTGSCQVSLLVPHPRRLAVLIADAGSRSGPRTPPRLPTLRVDGDEPLLSEILDSIDVVDATQIPPLRLVATSPPAADPEAGENDELALLVEFDTALGDAPAGCTWLDLDAEAIARLEPETARAAVASWARERAEGWSPLRPQWSYPGWFADASSWLVDQMAADGRPALSAPKVHQLWGCRSSCSPRRRTATSSSSAVPRSSGTRLPRRRRLPSGLRSWCRTWWPSMLPEDGC